VGQGDVLRAVGDDLRAEMKVSWEIEPRTEARR
jgi:hypothetical protein